MFLPTVYAWALTSCADRSAIGPECTRTDEKSRPKRGSMKARVHASSGRPDDCRVSSMLDGAGEPAASSIARRADGILGDGRDCAALCVSRLTGILIRLAIYPAFCSRMDRCRATS